MKKPRKNKKSTRQKCKRRQLNKRINASQRNKAYPRFLQSFAEDLAAWAVSHGILI